MPQLDQTTFQQTFGARMLRIPADEAAPFDFWSYVDAIPEGDYCGYDCSEGSVQWVWQSEDMRYEHVLIDSAEDPDVFMVIVLDLVEGSVFGHRLLDLKSEYGLRDEF